MNLEPITVEAVSQRSRSANSRSARAVFPAASNEARAPRPRARLLPGAQAGSEHVDLQGPPGRGGSGKTVSVLGSISTDDPYVRLDLVGEIAVAIMRQHEPVDRAVARSSEDGASSGLADDERRARESLMEGFRTMAIRRYATARGIPTSPAPPPEIESKVEAYDFGRWQATTRYCGYFFVRAVIGDTGPLSGIAAAFERPPTMTMELFRPSMSRDASRGPDPVPQDSRTGSTVRALMCPEVSCRSSDGILARPSAGWRTGFGRATGLGEFAVGCAEDGRGRGSATSRRCAEARPHEDGGSV